MTALATTLEPAAAMLAMIRDLGERANDYATASKAKSTRRAYAVDMADFACFAGSYGAATVPADWQLIAAYATHMADRGLSIATIRRRMVAISQAHKTVGHDSPTAKKAVRDVVAGIARTKGVPPRRKDALSVDLLRNAILALADGDLKAKRDRAIVLLGFAIAARRSELAALDVEDLRFDNRGLVVTIRRSKTDQEGIGAEIGVPYVANEGLCAARAVRVWLEAASITAGAVFRTFSKTRALQANRIDGADVARLVKRVTGLAGIAGDFAGHSLRAGFITSAASSAGVSEVDIMRVSRHKSVTILRGYVRRATVFDKAPLTSIFG
jgi:integrase